MTSYSLLNQAGTPSELDSQTNQVNGVKFTVSSAVTLTAIWVYSYAGAHLPAAAGLYSGSGTLVFSNTSPTWSGAAGSGWVSCACSQPLTSGITYTAAAVGPAGDSWYALTSGAWGPVTSGPLSCTSNPNCYVLGSSLAYPSNPYAAYNIWMDVEVSAGSTPGRGSLLLGAVL
jgi:hypothetical protein